MNPLFQTNDFDIFPLVFSVEENVLLTVQSKTENKKLEGDITVTLHDANAGSPTDEFSSWNTTKIKCVATGGSVQFNYSAKREGEYFVRLYKNNERIAQLRVYALEKDLACRYPLRGDFHVHTTGSDGRESPQIVCANYRKIGYDFIVITDHGKYYPSLSAIEFYSGVNLPINILPGEEVHMPGTPVHIVNAGGLFSVNGLLPVKENYTETGGAISKRRLDESVCPPDVLDMEEYWRQIDQIEKSLKTGDNPIPSTVNAKSYATCLWAFDKIKTAQGLGIFCHPYWIENLYQIPEDFTRYMLENHPFDAFEVLGGENYYGQNGLQTAMYYDEYRYGRVHPIVGSTDSHGSTPANRNYDICSTIVFAKANERVEILNAVKERFSVAVDTISKEYRLVGEYRLQKYASFLMETYFAIHDEQALKDGELMLQYALGKDVSSKLATVAKKAEILRDKYIKICR